MLLAYWLAVSSCVGIYLEWRWYDIVTVLGYLPKAGDGSHRDCDTPNKPNVYYANDPDKLYIRPRCLDGLNVSWLSDVGRRLVSARGFYSPDTTDTFSSILKDMASERVLRTAKIFLSRWKLAGRRR